MIGNLLDLHASIVVQPEQLCSFKRLVDDYFYYPTRLLQLEELESTDEDEYHGYESTEVERMLILRSRVLNYLHTMSSRLRRNHICSFQTSYSIRSHTDYHRLTQLLHTLVEISGHLLMARSEKTEVEYERITRIAFSSQYESLADVLAYVQEVSYGSEEFQGEAGPLQVVGEFRGHEVYLIDSHEKMRAYYNETSWCFARYGSQDYWYQYCPWGYCFVAGDYLLLADGDFYDGDNTRLGTHDFSYVPTHLHTL